jgi:hypothetical protein
MAAMKAAANGRRKKMKLNERKISGENEIIENQRRIEKAESENNGGMAK